MEPVNYANPFHRSPAMQALLEPKDGRIALCNDTFVNLWEIRVKDNGIGFEAKDAEFIFGPFRRLHASHQYPGSGVGLTLVRKVAHKHGGHAWAESVPNQGATFYFSLPRAVG